MPDIANLQVTISSSGGEQVQRTFDRLEQSGTRLASTIDRLQAQMGRFGQNSGAGLGSVVSQLQQIESQAQRAVSATSNLSRAMNTLGSVVNALAIGYVLKEISGYLLEAAQSAARFQTMSVVLTQVGQNAGYSRDEMLSYANAVQKSGIAMVESREIVARLAQAQINLAQSQQLARIAQDAATIGGVNSTEAMARMVHGIQSGQQEILRTMGINVSFMQSYQRLANTLNKATDSLTEQEKMQARANAVLEYGVRIAGTYEAAMGTAGKQILSFQRYLDDFKTKMGEAFNPTTTSVVMNAAETMKKLQDVISRKESQEALNSLANAIGNLANSITNQLPGALESLITGLNQIMSVWNGMPDWMKKAMVIGGAAAVGPRTALAVGGAVTMGSATDAQEKGLESRLRRIDGEKQFYNTLDPSKQYRDQNGGWNSVQDLLEQKDKERLEALEELARIKIGKIGYPQSGADAHRVNEFEENKSRGIADVNKYQNALNGMIDDTNLTTNLKVMASHDKANKEAKLDEDWAGMKKAGTAKLWALSAKISEEQNGEGDKSKIKAWQDQYTKTVSEMSKAEAGYTAQKAQLNKEREQEAKQLQHAVKLLDELEGKNKVTKMELRGDKYGAERARIDAEYLRDLDSIKERLIGAKAGVEELHRAEQAAADGHALKLMKVDLEEYLDVLKEVSKFRSDMASMGSGDAWEARRYSAWAEMEDTVVKNQANALVVQQAIAKYEQTIVDLKRQETAEILTAAGEYAELVGNSRERYDIEVKLLELEREHTTSMAKKAVLTEKISQLEAKRDGNVGRLTEMGMQKASDRAYDDYLSKVSGAIPQGIDSSLDAISGHMTDAITGVKTFGEAWKDLQKTISQAIVRILLDLAMAWAKKELFGLFGFGDGAKTTGQQAAAAVLSGSATGGKSSGGGSQSTLQGVASAVMPLALDTPSLGATASKALQSIAEDASASTVKKVQQVAGNQADWSSVIAPKGIHVEKLNSEFADRFTSMAKEFEERTGRKLTLSDAFRTREQQEDVYRRKPGLAAKPGYSMHEYGQAIDIQNSRDYEEIIAMGLGQKYGLDYLHGSSKTERWHWQTADSYGRQAEIRNGLGRDASEIGDFGYVGRDGVRALGSATSSYGAFGAFFGMLGAPSIINQLPKKGGLGGVLTGTDSTGGSLLFSGTEESATAALIAGSVGYGVTGGTDLSDFSSLGKWSDSVTNNSGYSAVVVGQDGQLYVQGSGTSLSQTASQQVTTQQTGSGSSGNSLGDLMKGNNSWTSNLDQWGYDNLGIGTSSWDTGAFAGKNVSGWTYADGSKATPTITGGLGSIASGAITGAMTGMSVASLVYPNGTGTVGGTVGGLIGGAAASATLGSVLGSFAGPIGGIVGGLVGSLVTGSETKKTEKTGSGITVDMTSGSIQQSGYSTYRTTKSGMFGSSSTSHSKSYDTVGDPEIEAEFRETFEKYQFQTVRSLKSMFLDTSALGNQFPFKFDIDSSNVSFAGKAVANYQALLAIKANGLQEDFDATAKSGEVYVDQVKRIGEAYSVGSVAAQLAGTSLEKLSGSLSKVYQGDWFSQLSDLMGGNDAASEAFTTLAQYGMKKTDYVDNALSTYGSGAGNAIAELGDSSVNINNFWDKYKEAVASGNLSADQMQNWANAGSWMKSFDDSMYSARDLMVEINNTRIAQLQLEMKQAQKTKVMVDGVHQSVSSAYSTFRGLNDALIGAIQGITWSSGLSPNSPRDTYSQQRDYYLKLKTKVAGEDAGSITYSQDVQKLTSFAQTFLQTSRSYYGASKRYYEDYEDVTGTLANLQTQTQSEVDLLESQLQAQYDMVDKAQQEIDQLQLTNASLALLGTGIDGLGTSIQAGLEALGASMSWSPSIGSAISDSIAAQSATAASLALAQESAGSTGSLDFSSMFGGGSGDLYSGGSGAVDNGDGTYTIPGFAAGGIATGPGVFRYNENGQEFMALGAGTSAAVTANDEFTGMLGQGNSISAAGFKGLQRQVAQQTNQLGKLASAISRQNSKPARAR